MADVIFCSKLICQHEKNFFGGKAAEENKLCQSFMGLTKVVKMRFLVVEIFGIK